MIMSFICAAEIFYMLHSSYMITPAAKNRTYVFEQRSIHTLTAVFSTDENDFSFDFSCPTL